MEIRQLTDSSSPQTKIHLDVTVLSSVLRLGMPSGPSLYCTTDDINPSGSTSLQPLDISIDISHSALTLKGVTFHLHTMLIKIHPDGLKKKRGHFCTFYFRKMREGKDDQLMEGIMKRAFAGALQRLENRSDMFFH